MFGNYIDLRSLMSSDNSAVTDICLEITFINSGKYYVLGFRPIYRTLD